MITSKTIPKIKNLVKLQKASERREQNRILIEGQREIERAQNAASRLSNCMFANHFCAHLLI